MRNRRARCLGCGKSGNTRGASGDYTCRPCRGLPSLAEVRAEKERKARELADPDALVGGRWVQDGWIQRWEVAS